MKPYLGLLAAVFVLAGCGGSGGDNPPPPPPPPPPPVEVTISPTSAQLGRGATQQFACTVTGATETRCSWSVRQGAAGGSVTAQGLYTAPAADGVFEVVATSVADPSRTAVAAVTVTSGGGAARPWVTGYYLGYYWDGGLNYPPAEVDMTAMTHLVFARVAPGSGSLQGAAGEVVRGAGTAHQPGLAPDGRSVEDYLIHRAHGAGTKALLMIGGMGDGAGFLRSSADGVRAQFVRRLVDYMVEHDYDGVDVDWEDELGTNSLGLPPEETYRRLRALISDIRTEANGRARYRAPNSPVLITFPGYAVSTNFLQPGGRVEQWRADVAHLVDQYNLMSYGIGMTFNGAGWDSWFTGPIAGSNGNRPFDLETSIAAYQATGVPRSKLGIGIGFYGIYYGPQITGPRQSTDAVRNTIYEVDDNSLAYRELIRKGYLGTGSNCWDDIAKQRYRVYAGGYVPAVDPRANPAGYLSYEDTDSILAKGAWVRANGVGGTIVWAVNYGYLPASRTNPLLDAVKQGFLQGAQPGAPTPGCRG